MSAPTVLGDIVTVPMVPVDSVTESELSAPNQYAVALPVRLGMLTSPTKPLRNVAPSSATARRARSASMKLSAR